MVIVAADDNVRPQGTRGRQEGDVEGPGHEERPGDAAQTSPIHSRCVFAVIKRDLKPVLRLFFS